MSVEKLTLEDLATLCKRRGFVYQASSLYGGLQGFFDYGPLGVELKNNIKNAWWKEMVHMRSDTYGLDSAVVMHQAVLNYSGHTDTFHDVLIDCKDCKVRFRDDEMKGVQACPKCGSTNISAPRNFNLMMDVNLGPTHSTKGILRPETAQGVFINFKNICDSFSPSLPFGIAQIGKAFRNEITPRNFVFRCREFEQMEMEFFVTEDQSNEFFNYWVEQRVNWWKKIGVTNIKTIPQEAKDLAHYSKGTTDICFEFPHGLEEIEGIANRGDFDLGSHSKMQDQFDIKSQVKLNKDSVDKLCMFDGEKNFIPCLVETSAGLDRAFLAVLTSAYNKEQLEDGSHRIVLKFLPKIAPVKVAIIPLAKNNETIVSFARKLFMQLKEHDIFPVVLENGGNIGKCYRKNDEIGTPFCITVDFESIGAENEENKDTVTIRDRDTMIQKRIHINELVNFLKEALR